jgi:tetratricopeptide (TPR) repeat protein
MMFSSLISLLSLVAVATVNIGDKAPDFISGTQWIKGNAPVMGNAITVVELWRTSCPKCRGQIPHLTSLQKYYGSRISVVSLNSEPVEVLNQFIKEHNDEIAYTVGHISKELMSQFLEDAPGVPYCFILDGKGNILWRCHPKELDGAIARALKGVTDFEKLKKIAALEKALDEAMESNQAVSMSKAINDLLAADPGNAEGLQAVAGVARYKEDPGLIKEIFDKIQPSDLAPGSAAKVAATLMAESDFSYRHPEAALKLAGYALSKEPENSVYMNTYAMAIYCVGEVEDAVEWQKKALKLDPANKAYQVNLDYYLQILKLRKMHPY